MSNFFTQLMAESDKQQAQLQQPRPSTPQSQAVFPEKQVIAPPEPTIDTVIPRHHETMIPVYRDTTTPPTQETPLYPPSDTLENVRRAVKTLGKEAATHRFTVQEKQSVAEIIFGYRQKGIKTSENEIARIALNYLIEEHLQQGEASFLAQVLSKLNT